MDNKNKYFSPDICVKTWKVERKNVFMQWENIHRLLKELINVSKEVSIFLYKQDTYHFGVFYLTGNTTFYQQIDYNMKNWIPFVIECTLRFDS